MSATNEVFPSGEAVSDATSGAEEVLASGIAMTEEDDEAGGPAYTRNRLPATLV